VGSPRDRLHRHCHCGPLRDRRRGRSAAWSVALGEITSEVATATTTCAADGRDRFVGGAGNDRIFGGSGPDRLRGRHGDVLLVGGADADDIDGQPGFDTCVSDSGDRVLNCEAPAP